MKVLIQIKNNCLVFQNKKRLSDEHKNMLNTNVISNNELVFSDEYIKENPKIIIFFLQELINNFSLNIISFQNMEIASLFIDCLKKIKNIDTINFESNEKLLYKYAEILYKLPSVKFVSAAFIPTYMFEEFNKNGIIAESKNEILFTSNFMSLNELNTYSQIYYKYTIKIDFPLDDTDYNDLEAFFSINNNLKVINISSIDTKELSKLINIINKYKHKNINILIHNNNLDNNTISYLKKYNTKYAKKYKIRFKLKYTNDYVEKNIIKQANINLLKITAIFLVIASTFAIGYYIFDNYLAKEKDYQIKEEINTYIQNNVIDNDENVFEKEEDNIENEIFINDKILKLKEINEDTIGWLKVNNTNIDYPIVKSTDNDYYLKHNFYKEDDDSGWLFLDYENNEQIMDQNMVIYGHNYFTNGIMFGTLIKTMYKSWYSNEENLVITFETLYGIYKYKVISVYVTPTTSDYIQTHFSNEDAKQKFIDIILQRNTVNFNESANVNDKILTLSTCQSNTTRLVLHAKMIEKIEDYQ